MAIFIALGIVNFVTTPIFSAHYSESVSTSTWFVYAVSFSALNLLQSFCVLTILSRCCKLLVGQAQIPGLALLHRKSIRDGPDPFDLFLRACKGLLRQTRCAPLFFVQCTW